jgi:hypothetical protein
MESFKMTGEARRSLLVDSGVCTPPGTLRRDGYLLSQLIPEMARSATILFQHGALTLDGQRELDEKPSASAARATVATPS